MDQCFELYTVEQCDLVGELELGLSKIGTKIGWIGSIYQVSRFASCIKMEQASVESPIGTKL